MGELNNQLIPFGKADFASLRQAGQIYVDKTQLIHELAKVQWKVFLARPRRFGKTLLLSTFGSLFSHGLRDFRGLAIESLWTEDVSKYKVVRLDFSLIKNFKTEEEFAAKLQGLLVAYFGVVGFKYEPNSMVPVGLQLSLWLQQQPPNSVVLLIDEYDSPLTFCLSNLSLLEGVRGQLSEFYSLIKNNSGIFRFLFITGITKFNKTSIFSELNDLKDISLEPKYGSLLGYTPEEVKRYFGDFLRSSASVLRLSENELLDILIKNYDGFCFEESAAVKVFSPWSLLNFFMSPERGFKNYWFESGGRPEVLLQYLKSHSLRNPLEYAKTQKIPLIQLSGASDPENLSDIGLLTQAGYLTIKRVEEQNALVNYPNEEVRSSMASLYSEQLLNGRNLGQIDVSNVAMRLVNDSAEDIYHLFRKIFASLDYLKFPVKDEATLRAFVQIFLEGSGLKPLIEVHNHQGRSDLEVVVEKRRWIFEFKVAYSDDSPDAKLQEGVEQVKKYGTQYEEHELKRMVLVFSVPKKAFVRWAECL